MNTTLAKQHILFASLVLAILIVATLAVVLGTHTHLAMMFPHMIYPHVMALMYPHMKFPH